MESNEISLEIGKMLLSFSIIADQNLIGLCIRDFLEKKFAKLPATATSSIKYLFWPPWVTNDLIWVPLSKVDRASKG